MRKNEKQALTNKRNDEYNLIKSESQMVISLYEEILSLPAEDTLRKEAISCVERYNAIELAYLYAKAEGYDHTPTFSNYIYLHNHIAKICKVRGYLEAILFAYDSIHEKLPKEKEKTSF